MMAGSALGSNAAVSNCCAASCLAVIRHADSMPAGRLLPPAAAVRRPQPPPPPPPFNSFLLAWELQTGCNVVLS
jgi:hypothetical protein